MHAENLCTPDFMFVCAQDIFDSWCCVSVVCGCIMFV